jgi:hypothetical protein
MKTWKLAILVASGLLAMAAAALAQEPPAALKPPEPPKPGPEVKKLAYFAGLWKTEGEVFENPVMPAGRITSTDNCEWFQGRFHLVCRSFGKGPMGETRGLGILGYNSEDKVYTSYGIDSLGLSEQGRGQVEGKTWTYTSESKMGGKPVSGRYTVTELTPTSYTFKYEVSSEGSPWLTIAEGQSTKIGSRPSAETTKKPR